MAVRRADLHVHSRYSDRPAEWFRLGPASTESYTEPLTLAALADSRNMDFLTVTDHNRIDGALELCERYPERAFTGLEASAAFPENGCRVNLLIYGFTVEEFARIDRLRHDLYALRGYLRERNLSHAVAHAVFSGGRLTLEDVEKLLLLFNVFEARNGSRGRAGNAAWTRILTQLTPERIADMARRHGILPDGPEAWRKGLIGGSDDHAGVFAGQTWTEAEAASPAEFLEALRARRTRPGGRHHDYRSLLFSTCKVAWDRSRMARKDGLRPESRARMPFDHLNELLFAPPAEAPALSGSSPALSGGVRLAQGLERSLDRLRLAAWAAQARVRNERWPAAVAEAAEGLQARAAEPLENRLEFAYSRIADLADEFIRSLLVALEQDLSRRDPVAVVRHALHSAPGLLLALPFFTAIRHLNRERELLHALLRVHGGASGGRGKRILWFTDTLADQNGPSTTLAEIGWMARRHSRDITLVGSLPPGTPPDRIPPGVVVPDPGAVHPPLPRDPDRSRARRGLPVDAGPGGPDRAAAGEAHGLPERCRLSYGLRPPGRADRRRRELDRSARGRRPLVLHGGGRGGGAHARVHRDPRPSRLRPQPPAPLPAGPR
jgi:hypothetical protein